MACLVRPFEHSSNVVELSDWSTLRVLRVLLEHGERIKHVTRERRIQRYSSSFLATARRVSNFWNLLGLHNLRS